MSEEPLRRKTYLIVGISVTCLLSLWMLSSTSSVISNTNTAVHKDNVDILYQELPQGKNICHSDDFNQGKWVHQSIGLESHSIEGFNSHAGYHCNWDFAHRCYRRTNQLGEFNRSKTM
jgi:hypothetical protein